MKVKKIYLGEEVFVEPIEELLTQKAFMSREKDIADLRLLKEIGFEKEKLIELAQDKGEIEKIISVLRSCGFEI